MILAMAFSRSASEVQVSDASDASVISLAVAEAGLDAFFSDTFTVRPQPGDSFRYNQVDGYAWVVPEELQRPADTVFNDVVFSVRSTGYLIEPSLGATPVGIRTIAQFARWQVGSINTQALYTSANGIERRSGGEYIIKGYGWGLLCNLDTIIAQSRTRNSPPAPDSLQSNGLAPITSPSMTDSALAVQTGIDWRSIVNGNFVPDYNAVQIGDITGFTSQLIAGNLTLASGERGSGLLMVTGDLTTTGTGAGVEWRGIVLVGGMLRANAERTDFRGVVVTGLNHMLGSFVPADTVGGSTGYNKAVRFLYELCFVNASLSRLTGMVPISRTRVDNWATY